MRKTIVFASVASILSLSSLLGCKQEDPLTGAEAQQTVDEVQIESQSQALTSNTIEVSTNFTIGAGAEQAALELESFVQTELPCAAVTVSAATLTIQYGAQGSCPFDGQTFTGTHTITISRNDSAEVVVDHTWVALSNGVVKVDGTAEVTWNAVDPSRHIQHDLTWKRLSDGRTGQGQGDRTQRPLSPGGLQVGFSEDGQRSWDGQAGHWDLDISDLEMRWVDPVPQAGSLTLATPFGKTVGVTFSRADAATIHVTVQGTGRSFGFDVHAGA